MIDWIFAILLIFAFLLMVLSIVYHDDTFWGGMFTILDIVMWFFLAVNIPLVETPAYQYNATTGSMESTLYSYTSVVAPELILLFYLFAIIMVVYFVGYFMFAPMYELITGKKWKDKANRKKE